MAGNPRLLAALVIALAGCGGPEDVEPPPTSVAIVVDEPAARRAAATFVSTAVARKRLAVSWTVTHPDLRYGYTRAEWVKGTIPVQPVPGARATPASFRMVEADDGELVYSVRLGGRRFLVTVKRVGEGGPWAVSAFSTSIAP